MTTVFVYEDVTATTAGGDRASPPAASLWAEGRAMLEAVTSDFRALPGIRVDQLSEPATANRLTEFARHAGVADFTLVIAPECGGRLEHLAREVVQAGGTLLGPSPDAIRLTADKLALAGHWDTYGVPTPKTWRAGEGPPGRTLVFKPRDGAGSQAISFHQPTIGEATSDTLIAQEYVPGFAASVAFLIGADTIMPLVPCAQRLSNDGHFQYRGGYLPIAPNLAERALRIAGPAVRCVPGLMGYVGVDVVLGDDGRDWAIEINPRVTTSYVGLRALSRANLAEAMLAIATGKPASILAWRDDAIEFTPEGGVSPLAR